MKLNIHDNECIEEYILRLIRLIDIEDKIKTKTIINEIENILKNELAYCETIKIKK